MVPGKDFGDAQVLGVPSRNTLMDCVPVIPFTGGVLSIVSEPERIKVASAGRSKANCASAAAINTTANLIDLDIEKCCHGELASNKCVKLDDVIFYAKDMVKWYRNAADVFSGSISIP